jgi:cation transport ATPase
MAELDIIVDEEATERLQKEEARGRTAVLVAEGQEIIGAVFLADTPRPEALPVGRAAQEERHSKRSHAHR